MALVAVETDSSHHAWGRQTPLRMVIVSKSQSFACNIRAYMTYLLQFYGSGVFNPFNLSLLLSLSSSLPYCMRVCAYMHMCVYLRLYSDNFLK